MPEDWSVYLAKVNDHIASICVDMSLWADGPNMGKPIVAWVFVDLQSPRPGGLPSAEEAPELRLIEDALEAGLEANGGVLAGMISSAGIREFYFYLSNEVDFAERVSKAMSKFANYPYEAGSQPDHDWDQYVNVLYPNLAQKRGIENRKILQALSIRGDMHHVPREIDHFAFFGNQAAIDDCLAWARSKGFTTEASKHKDNPVERSLGLTLSRLEVIDESSIDRLTIEIEEKVTELGGIYDGWGSVVVTEPDKPAKTSWLSGILKKKSR